MKIYTQHNFKVGQHVSGEVDSWPNLFPIKDAYEPDNPEWVHVCGEVTQFIEGNEVRLNVVIFDEAVIEGEELTDVLATVIHQKEYKRVNDEPKKMSGIEKTELAVDIRMALLKVIGIRAAHSNESFDFYGSCILSSVEVYLMREFLGLIGGVFVRTSAVEMWEREWRGEDE